MMTIGDEPLEAAVELGGRHLQEIFFFLAASFNNLYF
jgi:hypothetical protein